MNKHADNNIVWEVWLAVIANKQPINSNLYKINNIEMYFSNKSTAEKCLASMTKRPGIIGAGINKKVVYTK